MLMKLDRQPGQKPDPGSERLTERRNRRCPEIQKLVNKKNKLSP